MGPDSQSVPPPGPLSEKEKWAAASLAAALWAYSVMVKFAEPISPPLM